MKYRKILIKYNAYISQSRKYKNLYFRSSKNTTVKIHGLIFSRERNHKIGTTFFLFSQYGLREATLYGISVSFLRETLIGVSYFYGNVNKKSESLKSLKKERAFINSSATNRKSKQKLM